MARVDDTGVDAGSDGLIRSETEQRGAGRRRLVAFALLSLCALVLAEALFLTGSTAFHRYFGAAHPVTALFLIAAAGAASVFAVLDRREFLVFRNATSPMAIALSCGLPVVFATAAALLDVRARLPRDMNVPLPESLLFYPAIAYVAEVVFHVIPLTVFFVIAQLVIGSANRRAVGFVGMAFVALLEPAFQAAGLHGTYPPIVVACVATHVLVINATELLMFRRYGFVPMLLLRLVYYILWHVVWGYVRLRILF